MQFLVVALDRPGSGALRQQLRHAHLEFVSARQDRITFGGPIQNEDGTTIGSVLILKFPNRATLDEHLEQDPYFAGGLFEAVLVRQTRQVVPEIALGALAEEIARQRTVAR
jgi:uncharacterized protein